MHERKMGPLLTFRAWHFLRLCRFIGLILAVSAGGCASRPSTGTDRRVIVLGVDGMDPFLLENHFGSLPNLDKLRQEGCFLHLATSIPPQSPVAWSSFITGTDPGGHGVFDFIHRDPSTLRPFSSMAETREARWSIPLGPFTLPLSSPRVELLRRGTPFWQYLARAGIETTVIRMPNNFPPDPHGGRSLSGMGTPDLQGTYGTFTYYTNDPKEERGAVSGGRVVPVRVEGQKVEFDIRGPVNSFRRQRPYATVAVSAFLDPERRAARLDFEGGRQCIVQAGEWSDWVRLEFPVLPGIKTARGIVRFYLREIQPVFRLYVSPVNIDPLAPELPISTPPAYSRELAQELGLFYTQGLAEDTAALQAEVLTRGEYLAQSRLVMDEGLRLFRRELERFSGGFFFYYFSSLDQNSHILWNRHEDELLLYYRAIDAAVGEALAKAGRDTLVIVMSDHGFAPFERAVHLNTWLMTEGFLALDDPLNTGPAEMFAHVDWSRTRAYAMGLNAIYLNLEGREAHGIVEPGDPEDSVIRELADRLMSFYDPETGQRVVQSTYRPAEVYRGSNLKYAPDLIVGYSRGYRASWQTTLGAVPPELLEYNSQAWIGDHCIAAEAVPGVLLANRKERLADPGLCDLTATLLQEFGISLPAEMIGQHIF